MLPEPPPFADEEELRGAYRHLGQWERMELRRDARQGFVAASTRRAALLAWAARLELRRLPLLVGFAALLWLLLYLASVGAENPAAPIWLVLVGTSVAFAAIYIRPKLHHAAIANARLVAERTGADQPEHTGSTKVHWLWLALSAAAVVLLAVPLHRVLEPVIDRVALRVPGPTAADPAAAQACATIGPHWEEMFSPDIPVGEREGLGYFLMGLAMDSETAGFEEAAHRIAQGFDQRRTVQQGRFDRAVERVAEVCDLPVPASPG